MLDLLIANGMIIDGTGNPGFYGAVAVEGETRPHPARRRSAASRPRRRIDATGHVVCPGFIDMHAHSGLVILAEPHHEPKVRQGITTELIGDRRQLVRAVPHPRRLPDEFVQLNSGLDGDPPLPGRWSTVAEYLAMFDNRVAVNICYIVGNSPLRIDAVGWDDRPATRDELANMKALLREAMEEGAFGMSTGLDYPPGSYANTEELIELSREAAAARRHLPHPLRYSLGDASSTRSGGPRDRPAAAASRSTSPTSTSGDSRRAAPAGCSAWSRTRASEGLDVTFDSYPYIFSGTRLLILVPGVGAGRRAGAADRRASRSRDARERLRRGGRPAGGVVAGHVAHLLQASPHNHRSTRGARSPRSPIMLDSTSSTRAATCCWTRTCRSRTSRRRQRRHPAEVRQPPATRWSAATPCCSATTRARAPTAASRSSCAEFVREERFLSLPDAIRKMTSFPAQRLGLPDRGLLRDGFKADIVVFDPKTVKATATRDEPKQFPIGIEYVIVNGKVVIDGAATPACWPAAPCVGAGPRRSS